MPVVCDDHEDGEEARDMEERDALLSSGRGGGNRAETTCQSCLAKDKAQ